MHDFYQNIYLFSHNFQMIVLYSKENLKKMLLILISSIILKFVDKHLHPFYCLYENANNIMHDDVNCIW